MSEPILLNLDYADAYAMHRATFQGDPDAVAFGYERWNRGSA